MELALVIISAAIVIFFCRWYFQYSRFIKLLEKFPGPPPLPIVGNGLDFASPTGEYKPNSWTVKDYNGHITTEIAKVTDVWKSYLENLYQDKPLSEITITEDSFDSCSIAIKRGESSWGRHVNSQALLPKFLEYKEKYGGIVKVFIGPTPSFLLINDHAFLEYLLNSTKILNKSEQYRFLSKWLGTGLLLSDGDAHWKKHRKIITPTFHFQILEQFIDVFESASKVLVSKLKKEVGKPCVNIYPYITLCTLDIICETAMGTSINAQENSDSGYVRSVKAMCRIIVDRAFNPFLQYKLFYFLSSQYRTERRAIKILHNYTNSVIKKRRAALPSKQDSLKSDDGVGTKKRMAFLDLLLQDADNQTLTDQDIREEVDTFMFEGHDTTASAISFALFCLAEHPEVQAKVVEELHQIFSDDKTRSVAFRDLQNMKYMESVIKEVLRIYPSVPFYARHVHEDTEYDGGILPKGINLIINAYGIHRNPELFPEPEKFRPDRFSTENSAGRFPYGYIPFSAGARNCIGQKYAMLEMKSVLSMVLRHYELFPTTPKHTPVISAETVLLSSNGICISLAERKC